MNLSKISLALNLILIVFLAYLWLEVRNLSKGNNTADSSIQKNINPSDGSLTYPKGLVYVNIDSIDAKLNIIKNLRKEMDAEKSRSEASLKGKYKALEQEFIKAQEESKYYTQEQAAKKQNELMLKEQSLMKLEQEMSEKLLQQEAEKNKQLQKQINQALKDLQKTHQYQYVFGYNGWGNLIYAHDSMEITQEVIDFMNQSKK